MNSVTIGKIYNQKFKKYQNVYADLCVQDRFSRVKNPDEWVDLT